MFDTSLSPKKSHKVATSQSAGLWRRNQSWSTVRGIETKNWSDCNGNLLEIREKISEKPKFCEKSAGNLSFLGILRESVGKKQTMDQSVKTLAMVFLPDVQRFSHGSSCGLRRWVYTSAIWNPSRGFQRSVEMATVVFHASIQKQRWTKCKPKFQFHSMENPLSLVISPGPKFPIQKTVIFAAISNGSRLRPSPSGLANSGLASFQSCDWWVYCSVWQCDTTSHEDLWYDNVDGPAKSCTTKRMVKTLEIMG